MKATMFLIAFCIILFIIPFFTNSEDFYNTYAFSGSNFMERPYVFITSIFMHASATHLLSNILVWLFFGLAVENEMGWKKMLLIFFLGAAVGDVFGLLFYGSSALSVGASAGIFALVGAGMLVRPLDLSLYPLVVPVPLIFIGIMYALYNAYAFALGVDPDVSYVGHFGGLIIGLLFGFRQTGVRKGMKMVIVSVVIMLAILVAVLAFKLA